MDGIHITKPMASRALNRMHCFNKKLSDLYESEGLDISKDIGRRNILMSSIQEKEFSKELSEIFDNVKQDGRSGQPDIVIEDIGEEIECKITSPHSGKTWALQCDYETLRRKGELDFLYVLVDKEFENAAVLYFKKLTIEDFHPPASGSRGKSRMRKHIAMEKCTSLYGEFVNRNVIMIEKAKRAFEKSRTPNQREKALKRIANWGRKENQYSFELESIVGNS